MTFAEKVRYARATLMVTQDELAKLVGVSRITITRWESNDYKPRLITETKFEKFCKSKGITFEE
jgi:DNA-binding XRE family transcriptional regulator